MPEGATWHRHSTNYATVVVTGIDLDGLLKSVVSLVYGTTYTIDACRNFVPTFTISNLPLPN